MNCGILLWPEEMKKEYSEILEQWRKAHPEFENKADSNMISKLDKYIKSHASNALLEFIKTLEKDWATPTLKEAPFWRNDMTPAEYEVEREYWYRNHDKVVEGTYVPLWKQTPIKR